MDRKQRNDRLINALEEFIIRASSKEAASSEEIMVLPEVAKLVLSYNSSTEVQELGFGSTVHFNKD